LAYAGNKQRPTKKRKKKKLLRCGWLIVSPISEDWKLREKSGVHLFLGFASILFIYILPHLWHAPCSATGRLTALLNLCPACPSIFLSLISLLSFFHSFFLSLDERKR
jgi:hypothetical protein